MKLTKSKLKEMIREEILKEQALFPVRIDMQVDFTGTESSEEKFVADVEKAIQGVIDNSSVNVTWTVNDYSMNEEIRRLNEAGKIKVGDKVKSAVYIHRGQKGKVVDIIVKKINGLKQPVAVVDFGDGKPVDHAIRRLKKI